jgi:hypothetical protein
VRFREDGAKVRYCKKCETDVGTIGASKASRQASVTG